MTIKYDILDEIPDYQPEKEVEEQLCFPEDLSEAELVEMLTEVMSIMLFNKDEKMQEFQSAANGDKKAQSLKKKKPRTTEPDSGDKAEETSEKKREQKRLAKLKAQKKRKSTQEKFTEYIERQNEKQSRQQ